MNTDVGKKIAFVGCGAVGGYAGAHMAQAGEDVTFIDPWPEHVEHMRKHGLHVTHAMKEPEFTVPVRALHVTEAQQLAKEKPFDIAFVCMKSYDTEWAAMLIKQYLAPDGFIVSLQNCMNEETHRRRRRLGQDRRLHRLEHHRRPVRARPHSSRRRQSTARSTRCSAPAKCMAASPSARKNCAGWSAYSDSAKVTNNLWGERWSKLVANAMENGVSACTGLGGGDCSRRRDPPLLDTARRRGDPRRPGATAISSRRSCTSSQRPSPAPAKATPRPRKPATISASRTSGNTAAGQRPSMGQDMLKGRRTEIEFLNGLIVREGEKVGINAAPTRRWSTSSSASRRAS